MERVETGKNYVRYAMGRLGVIALRDGYVDMPSSRLRRTDGRAFGADLPAQVDLVDGKLRLSVNAFLVVDGDRHVLIDTGASNAWEPTMGVLLDALDEAGVARESIATVAFTHTHIDHVNGLVAADGSDAFPNLTRLLVPREEIALFDAEERLARFRSRRSPLDHGFALGDSVTAIRAHGHEIGHTAFEVTSAGETLVIWGDVVHVPSIQFARPEIAWELDTDRDQARLTRLDLLRRAAREGLFVAGAHLDFPGVGTVTEFGRRLRLRAAVAARAGAGTARRLSCRVSRRRRRRSGRGPVP